MITLLIGVGIFLSGIIKSKNLSHDDIFGHRMCVLSWIIGGVLAIIGATKVLL